jgi:hypothetical protein
MARLWLIGEPAINATLYAASSDGDAKRVAARRRVATDPALEGAQLTIGKYVGSSPSRRDGSMDYLGSRFRACGINMLELVSHTFASWNRIAEWLRRLAALRRAA